MTSVNVDELNDLLTKIRIYYTNKEVTLDKLEVFYKELINDNNNNNTNTDKTLDDFNSDSEYIDYICENNLEMKLQNYIDSYINYNTDIDEYFVQDIIKTVCVSDNCINKFKFLMKFTILKIKFKEVIEKFIENLEFEIDNNDDVSFNSGDTEYEDIRFYKELLKIIIT